MEHMSMLNANPGTSCWAHCRRSCTTPTVAFATSTFPLTPSFPWCTAARRDRVPPRPHPRPRSTRARTSGLRVLSM